MYNSIPEGLRPKLKKMCRDGRRFTSAIIPTRECSFYNNPVAAHIEDKGLFGHDLLKQGSAEILYTEGAIRCMGVSIPCKQMNKYSPIR